MKILLILLPLFLGIQVSHAQNTDPFFYQKKLFTTLLAQSDICSWETLDPQLCSVVRGGDERAVIRAIESCRKSSRWYDCEKQALFVAARSGHDYLLERIEKEYSPSYASYSSNPIVVDPAFQLNGPLAIALMADISTMAVVSGDLKTLDWILTHRKWKEDLFPDPYVRGGKLCQKCYVSLYVSSLAAAIALNNLRALDMILERTRGFFLENAEDDTLETHPVSKLHSKMGIDMRNYRGPAIVRDFNAMSVAVLFGSREAFEHLVREKDYVFPQSHRSLDNLVYDIIRSRDLGFAYDIPKVSVPLAEKLKSGFPSVRALIADMYDHSYVIDVLKSFSFVPMNQLGFGVVMLEAMRQHHYRLLFDVNDNYAPFGQFLASPKDQCEFFKEIAHDELGFRDGLDGLVQRGFDLNVQCPVYSRKMRRSEWTSLIGLLMEIRDSFDVPNPDLLKYLLDSGLDINAATPGSKLTPLMLAIDNEVKVQFIEKLFNYNLNLDAQDIDGDTAMHHAAKLQNFSLYHLLIISAANPRIKNNDGKTADEYLKKRNLYK